MPKTIDLRSDTITRPSEGMRRAMYEAEVGDDVFGDDPTVIRLQERVAELLGKEAALYVPSGTMANQIALCINTRPGDEVYCESGCHVFNFEGGAAGMISGVMLHHIDGFRGAYTADQVAARLRPTDHHFAPSRLIWVENTANRAGGTIFPQNEILRLKELADANNMGMHLDGARIWNAAVATGMSEKELAEPFDTVNVCLSKGLGAPVGSLIVGSKEMMNEAHRFRKRLGGGMRQSGIIAAAGLYAVENNRERLQIDHRRAYKIAGAISEIEGFSIDLEAVASNIVIFDVAPGGRSGTEVTTQLEKAGIRSTSFGLSFVRLVTHLDLTDEDIDQAICIIKENFA